MRRRWFLPSVLAGLVALVVAGTGYLAATRGAPDEAWHTYSAERVGMRFAHPPDWQVRAAGDRGVRATGAETNLLVEATPNPDRLSAREWAQQRAQLGEWEVTEQTVSGAEALVLRRYGTTWTYLERGDDLYVVRWRGDQEEFTRWLDSVELVAPAGSTASPEPPPSPDAEPRLREFTPQEFVDLFYQAELDVTPIEQAPSITGDAAADDRIVAIAEESGYRLQSEATGQLPTVDGEPAQPAAVAAWERLAEAAAADGITMEVVSGFRSVDDQRAIFQSRLAEEGNSRIGRPYTESEIADGAADDAIDTVLETSSIPGYSKHHTGYALDVRDVDSGQPFTRFGETAAYEWISADNFANAKRFGFIPSYPHGVERQGPMPEEWEFVWVGEDMLRQ